VCGFCAFTGLEISLRPLLTAPLQSGGPNSNFSNFEENIYELENGDVLSPWIIPMKKKPQNFKT
jgi:hypothetical protein